MLHGLKKKTTPQNQHNSLSLANRPVPNATRITPGSQLLWIEAGLQPRIMAVTGPRDPTHPGFISSQASSCPALGASVPVRIFPLSTWITFTGRSLIWLVSSRGWKRVTCGMWGSAESIPWASIHAPGPSGNCPPPIPTPAQKNGTQAGLTEC